MGAWFVAGGCASVPPETPNPTEAVASPASTSAASVLSEVPRERTQWLMGTALRLVVFEGPADSARGGALERTLDRAFAEVQRWEALLSDYDPRSPLSRINAAAGSWVPVPAPLLEYLRRCQADWRRTDGVFDPTVGTWKSGVDPRVRIGWPRVQIEGDRVRLPAPLRLDPGGNGKGWAVDRVVQLLRTAGVRRALIDFGGSSWYGLGSPPAARAWTVAVTGPDGRALGTASFADAALSVSSSVQIDHEADGRETRRLHLFDPRTGRRVEEAVVVVVRSPSATDAEVLSTAIAVAGEAGAAWLARYPGAEAVRIEWKEPADSGGHPDWWLPTEDGS